MKTSVVLLAVLVFNVQAIKLKFSLEYEPRVKQYRKECAEIKNVDFKYLTRLDHIDIYTTPEELKCLVFCIVNKFNAVDQDDRFRNDIIRNFFTDPILKDSAENAIEMCLPEDRKISTCKDANDLYKCFLSKV